MPEKRSDLQRGAKLTETVDDRLLAPLLGSVRDAVVHLGADGLITEWNGQAGRLFGYRREEAVGRPYDMLIPPDQREPWLRALERLRTESGTVELEETAHLAKGGRLMDVSLALAPVRTADGDWVGTWSIARDLSERKAAEGARVEFLALLGHELRNPLGAMISAIGLLELPAVEETRAVEALQILKRQGHHLSRLVDDLLEVSRITRGRIELRRQELDLGQAVELAVRSVRAAVEEQGHRIWVSVPPETVRIEADPDRFEQILANLLRNSVTFTEAEGEIWVAVETTEGGEAVVRVRDNGIGIEPELLTRVFEPFVQGGHGLAKPQGALGIGLTMVRRLVELQGGTVEAHSDGVGRGAELVVRFPVLADTTPPGLDEAAAIARGESPRRRILLVDDHRDAANALSELLASFGHEVTVALDGATAVSVARTFVPEVVLLDLGLPGMDGFQVARELRREATLAGALLVAVTGYGHQEAREQSRAAGFDLHLVKPVDPEKLQELLAAQERLSSGEAASKAPA